MDKSAAESVLIVDDDPDMREVFRSLFDGDCRVLAAAGGEEALELLKEHRPRLMVLDLSMPGMSGIEVLRSARKAHPSLCVIMLTSERDVQVAQSALALGACQFITKPFSIEYLRAEIRRAVAVTREAATDSGRPWRVLAVDPEKAVIAGA